MKYRLLGHSGLRVSGLALGTMTFGEDWSWGAPKDEARKTYYAYREAGGNFSDTSGAAPGRPVLASNPTSNGTICRALGPPHSRGIQSLVDFRPEGKTEGISSAQERSACAGPSRKPLKRLLVSASGWW